MTKGDRLERDLQRYYDRDLGFLGRLRIELRLRASVELRARLQELRDLGELMREIEGEERPPERPEAWRVVGPALAAIDREVSATHERQRDRSAWALPNVLGSWRSLAGATVATAAALWMFFLLDFPSPVSENAPLTVVAPLGDGALRYLKTDGRPVVVSQEQEGVTIIWLMDRPVGA
jgi:hypothetical protein